MYEAVILNDINYTHFPRKLANTLICQLFSSGMYISSDLFQKWKSAFLSRTYPPPRPPPLPRRPLPASQPTSTEKCYPYKRSNMTTADSTYTTHLKMPSCMLCFPTKRKDRAMHLAADNCLNTVLTTLGAPAALLGLHQPARTPASPSLRLLLDHA